MFRFFAGFAVTWAALFASPIAGQMGATERTVVIELVDDYPLFQPDANPAIRAAIVRFDPVDRSRSVIVVNPAYLTPAVVYSALGLVGTEQARSKPGSIGLAILRYPLADSDIPLTQRTVVEALIIGLKSTEPSYLRGQPYGRHLEVSRKLIDSIALEIKRLKTERAAKQP